MRVIPTLAALLAACATSGTEIVNSWKEPSAQTIKFNKVVAVCQCKDGTTRRTVEDQLAKRLQRTTPSYTLISDAELKDAQAAKAKIQQGGFDGAVVMQLARVEKEQTYIPGQSYVVAAPYGSMYGGWGYGWAATYDPGYVVEDQLVSLNSYVYSVKDEKLLWASRSKSENPSSVPQLVDEIIAATAAEMKKQGVLTE
jgi:hypothetical protein